MTRDDLSGLMMVAAIAEERSFTRAAVRLGVSSSALSHALRALEVRLGVKLLHRTTRSVSPTEAGERLLAEVRPALAEIARSVEALGLLRDRPAGRVRISAHRTAALLRLAPVMQALRRDHPDVIVEVSVQDELVDIVAAGFDAGVRRGERVERDMIAVRISPDQRSAVIASPAYLARRPAPLAPEDVAAHPCLSYRHATSGALQRWDFGQGDRLLTVDVEPVFIANDGDVLVRAALDGLGLAYVVEELVQDELASGALVSVLGAWSVSMGTDFLYYPNRQVSPALRVVIDALKAASPT